MKRVSWLVLGAVVISGVSTLYPAQPALGAPTACNLDYDWAQQWTGTSVAFYHPGSGCPSSGVYYGWVGIDGQLQTPTHYPDLGGNSGNHSAGWLDVSFSVCGTCQGNWIQIGWFAGCLPGLCRYVTIGLYDEEQITINGTTTYTIYDDGVLNYNTPDIYDIAYYGSGTWKVFDHYNNLLRVLYNRPGSGTMRVGAETCCATGSTGPIEMPTQYFGSAYPNTNSGLRIMGANGFVAWTSTLSTGGTSDYDERNCPSTAGGCPNSIPYYLSMLDSSYYFYTEGS